MTVLVTGGAGFIGSHIADALLDDGLGRTADWSRTQFEPEASSHVPITARGAAAR